MASQNGWPAPVYERQVETDASYQRCTDALLAAWPHLRPAFGSHNPRSIAQAIAKSRHLNLDARAIEFQMLYGMAEGLRNALLADGYRVRVYLPVGEIIPGMAYLVRRLLENTSSQIWFRGSAGRHPSTAAALSTTNGSAGSGWHRTFRSAEIPADTFHNVSPARFFDLAVRRSFAAALAQTRQACGERYPLLIGDRQVEGPDWDEIRYPTDPHLVIGQVVRATTGQVDEAVALARRAFPAWRDRPVEERTPILRRAADLVEARRFELAALMVYESAKPWAEADGDVAEAIDHLRYAAAEAKRIMRPRRLGRVLGEENTYFYEGRGVAAISAPWNFPLAIITGMTGAALAMGNCAILKPAE